MHVSYFREQSEHDVRSLSNKLNVSEEKAEKVIKDLSSAGILRPKTREAPLDEFSAYSSSERPGYSEPKTFQIVFVGIVVVDNCVLICYPKYVKSEEAAPQIMQQILYVLRRFSVYSSLAELIPSDDPINNEIATYVAILENYSANGIYSNQQIVSRINGDGEIDWSRSINDHVPVISNGSPVYVELCTRATILDSADYFARLHRYVVTECSRRLRSCHLLDILSFDEVLISSEELDDFGGIEYIAAKLQRERSSQFVTWKQDVLQLLELFFNLSNNQSHDYAIDCFGTNSFHVVWERACKAAFGDMLDRPLRDIGINLDEKWKRMGNTPLEKLIDKPCWGVLIDGDARSCDSKGLKTLIPDIVTIFNDSNGKTRFGIFDAKYYCPKLSEHEIQGVPGIESVTKQILYQRAYSDFIRENAIDSCQNAFLFPKESDGVDYLGYADFPIMERETPPLVNGIDCFMLSAYEVFDSYLNDRPLEKDTLSFLLRHRCEDLW